MKNTKNYWISVNMLCLRKYCLKRISDKVRLLILLVKVCLGNGIVSFPPLEHLMVPFAKLVFSDVSVFLKVNTRVKIH